MKERTVFGEMVALTIQDLRTMALGNVAHMEDMSGLVEALYGQQRNRVGPSRASNFPSLMQKDVPMSQLEEGSNAKFS